MFPISFLIINQHRVIAISHRRVVVKSGLSGTQSRQPSSTRTVTHWIVTAMGYRTKCLQGASGVSGFDMVSDQFASAETQDERYVFIIT